MKASDYLDDNKPSASSFLDSGQPTGFKTKSLAELLSTYGQPNTLNEGAKVVSGLPGILEVGARRGYAGIGKVEQGALSILGDLLNSEALRGASDVVGNRARQIENSAVLQGKRSTGFAPESIVNDLPEAGANAVSSVIQTAPSLLAGAALPGAALPALFGQTFGQEYAQGKDAGLTPMKAAGRAVPMAAFEVAGEKLGGFDSLAAGLRKATAGNGVADLGSAMLSSALKEIPSEEFTTTGQFLTDKAPVIGINQDATLADYGQQVKDTALTTALQSGAMGAGGRILQGRSAPGQSVMTGMDQAQDVQPEQPAAQPVINPDAIVSAISQATSNVKPSAAAFLDSDTTEAPNVSQPTQQSVTGLDPATTGLQPDNGAGSPATELTQPNANAGGDSAVPNGALPASDISDGALPAQQPADLAQATTEQSSAVEPVFNKSLTTQASKKQASKPRANTLLSAIDGLGGIDNKYKWDISGEQKFARGGYNKVFKNASTKTLEQHIENGDLDEFLPYDMRSTVTDDPTAGRDYLADRIRNGDRVLPYDVELEAKQSKAYEQLNPQDDIAAIGDDIDLEEINRLLSEAGYVERETAADNASPASTGQIENAQPESANSNADGGQGTQRSDAREAAPANEVTGTPGSNEREGARQHVEAIVKRRSAANQIGKSKPFDNALKLAKDFLNGEDVSPSKFRNAASTLSNDKQLSDAFTALAEMAKAPARENRQSARSAMDVFTEQVNNAKTVDELKSISRNIQMETGVVSDAMAQQLDDMVMARIDALSQAETDEAPEASNEAQPAAEEANQNFALQPETNQEILAREQAQREAEAEKARADAKEKADADRADAKRRVDAQAGNVDNFVMGESSREAAKPQTDMFGGGNATVTMAAQGSNKPPEDALTHAKEMGGRVVWHKGDIALIEGYSMLSGDAVYIPTKGNQRARIDIDRFKPGNNFTEQEIAELKAAKQREVERVEEELAKNPNGVFGDNSLVFGDDIKPSLRGVAEQWIQMLGLSGNRIVITTPASGAEMSKIQYGRFKRIGKAQLEGDNTGGVMQPLGDGDYHIAIRPNVSTLKTLEVLAHELGHIVEKEAFKNAPQSLQDSIKNEHKAWLDKNKGGRAIDMATSMRAYRTGRGGSGFDSTKTADDASYYWKSFSEWFADQVSRWATTQAKPQTAVEQFFKQLADKLKTFFVGEKSKFLPTETVSNWLNSLSPEIAPSEVQQGVDKPAFKRSDDNDLSNAAKQYFGMTMNKNEAGYILPDGVMLDFSGKHQASKTHHKHMTGERSVDHRELFGENLHNGSSLDGLLEAKNGNDAMLEFMRKTGAMRVDFQSGVASIAVPPTQKQIAALGNGMRGEYLAIEYFDPSSGRIIDDVEIESANPIKVKKFFDEAVTKAPDENAPMFKRDQMLDAIAGIKQQQKQIVDDVKSYVDQVTEGWKNAPVINVVYDLYDTKVPQEIRDLNEEQEQGGATGTPSAFIYKNRVYVVASQMTSAKDVLSAVFHESLGHYGLRGVFQGKTAISAALSRVATMRSADVAKKAKQYGLDISKEADRLLAAEEVLAELAETRPEIGVVKQIIAAIRSWLRDNVPYFKNLELSDAEIIRDYILPARRYVETGGKEQTAGDVVAAFQRSKEAEPKRSMMRDELGRWKAPTSDLIAMADSKIKVPLTDKRFSEISKTVIDAIAFGQAPKELRTMTRLYKADIQKAMDAASNVVKTMAPMSQLDRALVSDVVEKMVATGVTPPESIVKIATGMQNAMDIQTDELVSLGMLSQDSADRWRGKYLPRFYMRENTEGVKAWVGKMLRNSLPVRGIGGNSLKGRGLFEEVNVNEVPKYEALGWEVRDPLWKKNRQGELELVDENKVVTPEKVVVWRDWTASERAEMGENRDALFRFVMGYTSMQNDIALGRLFDSIAKNQEWTRARASDGYVQVPDSEIPDTGGVKRYGNLAGLYVKKEILDHISQYEESSELWKYYRKALSFWKAGKTVLNPVAHVNNVVSNLTMAHFAGVSYWDSHKYVAAIKDLASNAPMVQEAKDRGLMTGDITRAELMADMPDDIKAMMEMQESQLKRSASTVFNIGTLYLSKPMGKAYRFEDDFFKYLIYRDARKNGLSPDDAVDYATKYIFTYDDLPKGARTVRDLAIPFFAYTYKAVPALTHTLLNYPWRFAAPAAAVWGVNAVAFALAAGDDGDDWQTMYEKGKDLEDEERKNLPPWMQGRSALGASKSIRLGTDEKTQLPVYMDVSRMIPGGDIFDVTNQAGGVPVPAPIMPSNPVLTTIAAMFWKKDTFTGKELTDINDTGKEAAKKRAGWLLKQITPAVAPTGYHADRLAEAVAQMSGETISIPFVNFGDPVDYTGYGKDGLPVQGKYAVGQTFGIKARPIDLERSGEISDGQDNKEINSIISEIDQAERLLDQKAISQREYDRRVSEAEAKIDAIENK